MMSHQEIADRLSAEIGRQVELERSENRRRGMEICFALHHPNGHVFVSEDPMDLAFAMNEDPLKDDMWLDHYFEGTVIHPNSAPKVTLGDLLGNKVAA